MDQANISLKAEVNEYKISPIDSKVILFYLIITKRDGQTWTLEKRYSEFDELNNVLVKMYTNLPALPGKTLFKLKEHADIEKRRLGLDYYIKVILKINEQKRKQIVSRQEVFHSEAVKAFLQLEKHAQEQVVNPPKLLAEITGFIHGLRDFLYERNQNVIFALTSDMNVASRMDAYLTNMKMPWEKEAPPTLLAVGCLECWIKSNSDDEFKYERIWNKTYPSQAICMYWDQSTSYLLIGLDEGRINVLKIPAEKGFLQSEDIGDTKFQHHQGRVMGVFYDSLTNTIHSVSEDKKYKVHDLNRLTLLAEVQPSNFGLTCMIGDREGRRVFMADRGGYVHIYELMSNSQSTSHCATVATQTSSAIRGLAFDSVKNYLFSAGYDQGEIGIFDVGKVGREKYTKQTASLKGKNKIREVVWSTSRGEAMVGNEDGTVTIWSSKKAAPIYVVKAHNNDITKLAWYEEKAMLVTSSKEKSIKFWQLPKEWRDKKLEAQEEYEWEQQKKQENILKSQQMMQKKQYDSDEDDLAGWHK